MNSRERIIMWFEQIEQIATDRKTQNGVVMQPQDALDEIRAHAKDSAEYIRMFVKSCEEK